MKLRDIYKENKIKEKGLFSQKIPSLSFEIYPPKDDEDGVKLDKLIHHLSILKKYLPSFVSLTYGAGGGTRDYSLHIIKKIQEQTQLNIMPHFTCVATKKSQISEYLKSIKALNIENIFVVSGIVGVIDGWLNDGLMMQNEKIINILHKIIMKFNT